MYQRNAERVNHFQEFASIMETRGFYECSGVESLPDDYHIRVCCCGSIIINIHEESFSEVQWYFETLSSHVSTPG
jgi:hypothetical protein